MEMRMGLVPLRHGHGWPCCEKDAGTGWGLGVGRCRKMRSCSMDFLAAWILPGARRGSDVEQKGRRPCIVLVWVLVARCRTGRFNSQYSRFPLPVA
jgi:hypothetical protein